MTSSSRPDGPVRRTAEDPAARIDALAARLIEAREHGRAIDQIPEAETPVDAVEAQLVDDRVAGMTGWPVLGWKIGCTSEQAQQMLGYPEPFAGRIYSMFDSGHTLTGDQLCSEPRLEGEFAFTLGRDLEPGVVDRSGFGREAALASVAELRPAIELVGGRYANFVGLPVPLLIADGGANSHLVLGPSVTEPDLAGLASVAVTMSVDGSIVGRGSGADVLGHPLDALAWLVSHLGGRGISLTEGQMVTTGSATGVSPFPGGTTATATFDGIGSVSVSRSG